MPVYESLVKDGISIDDELRCSLLDQTSLNYDLFDEDEQSEFIFRLFKMIVLGQGVRTIKYGLRHIHSMVHIIWP